MVTRSVLVLCMVFLGGALQAGDGQKPTPLQSRLKVNSVSAKGGSLWEVELTFTNDMDKEQSFKSNEYRMVVLDKNGEQVGNRPLEHTAQIRDIVLKGRSTSDKHDIFRPKLKAGEDYFLVVSVRNLTAHLKFTAK